jgi:aryl-alcohol dehydrogenase-like predicted oxidoreductase
MLGGNVFGWTADRTASFAVLDRFRHAGLNAIDTADVYSAWVPGNAGGESEAIIGDWLSLRGGRDRLIIATKVGATAATGGGVSHKLSADHIVRSAEASLTRLRTDYIDLYQAHGDDPGTPFEESLEAFDRLVRAGKVRAIGASHFAPDRLAAALATSDDLGLARFCTIQPRYNLCERSEFEGPLQALCTGHDVGALCYSALAKGFLTGKFRSVSDVEGRTYARFLEPHLDERGLRILRALDGVAGEHRTTAAAVAIAWVAAQPGVAAAIAAVDTPDQLNELLGAVELSLTPEEIALLDDISHHPGALATDDANRTSRGEPV